MEKNVAETPFSVHTISFRCENDPRVAKKSSQASLSKRIYVRRSVSSILTEEESA